MSWRLLRAPSRPAQSADRVGVVPRLALGTANYGLGQLLPQVIGFLLLPLYASLLTPHDYGIADLAMSLAGFLAVGMRWGLPGSVTRFYYDHPEGVELRDYVSTIHRFTLWSSLTIGGAALLVFWSFGDRLLPGLAFYPFIVLVVVTALASGTSDLQRRLVQAREQSGYSARLSVAFAGVGILLNLLLVAVLRWGALGIVLANAIVALLFFGQAQRYLRSDLGGRFRPMMLRGSLRYAAGVLPSHLAASLTPLLSKTILVWTGSLAAVGVLGMAQRFILPLTLVSAAFNSAYLPVYFSLRKENSPEAQRELVRVVEGVWLLAVLAFAVVALALPPVLRLITPATYHAAGALIPILAVAFLGQVVYQLAAAEVYFSKRTGFASVPWLASQALLLLVAAYAAPRFGAIGVAAASAIGSLSLAGVAVIIARRMVRLPYTPLGTFAPLAIGAAVLAASSLAQTRNPLFDLMVGAFTLLSIAAILWWSRPPAVLNIVSLLARLRHPSVILDPVA